MKKKIIIGLSLFSCIIMNAQEHVSYLNFGVGGGLHSFLYDHVDGMKQDNKAGYTINVGYSFFFNPAWGIQSGVGLKTFSGTTTLNQLSVTPAVDAMNRNYEFRAKFENFQENQNAIFLNIPIALQFCHQTVKNVEVIGSLGAEVAFPIYKRYSSAGKGDIVTTGYYSQWNTELSELPEYGFTTITDAQNGELPFNNEDVFCSGIADIGELIRLTDNAKLYIGGYLNVGLNNILKSGSKSIYQPDGVYNGVFSSSEISRMIPVAGGIKIGVYFRMGHKNPDGNSATHLPN